MDIADFRKKGNIISSGLKIKRRIPDTKLYVA
jgi:hypothetical protein